jgi:hypothetical protein
MSKEMRSSYIDSTDEEISSVMDENTATALNENLARIALPQLSSHEQFRLADTIECVAMVEKHRRSMDDNAARYLLFFRQHMLRRTQGVANKDAVSWREIVWAYHSSSQDILTDLVSRQFNGKLTWKAARESGIFMWLSDPVAVVSIAYHISMVTRIDSSIRKHNSRSSLGVNTPRQKSEIPSTALCITWLLGRRMFSRVSGVSHIGTANKQPRSVCCRMTSKNNDGRHPHSRMPTHCSGSDDLVTLTSFPQIETKLTSIKNMLHLSSFLQTTYVMLQM